MSVRPSRTTRPVGGSAKLILLALSALVAIGAAPIATLAPANAIGHDCDTSWASPADGDWNVEANWDNGLPGVKGPNVCIEVPGTYTVHIGASEEDSSNATASAPDLFLGGGSGEQTLELTGLSFWDSSNPANPYRPKTVDAQLDIGSGFIGPNGKLLLDDNRFYHAVPPDVTVSAPGGITNEGTVVADPGSGGDRTIKGSLNNHGTVSIPNRYTTAEGSRPGTLDVRGCYCQDQGGTLHVSANGDVSKYSPRWSHLEANVAQLDGTLAGYVGVADPGERFRIITADRIDGSFSTVALGSGVKVEYGGDFFEDHVDLVVSGPPNTTIDSGPTGTTNDNTPTFTFSADEAVFTFDCKVDGGSFSACSSPETVASLTDGLHTFTVRATDRFGNPDPSPATRSFTVNATAPNTTIDSGPTGLTNDNTPTFTFSSDKAGVSFACFDEFDFGTCSGPGASHTIATLPDGPHSLMVTSIDSVGNSDPTPATRDFIVDTTAPDTTITKQPKSKIKTKEKSVTVKVSFESEQGAKFECKLDEAAYGPCTSPYSVEAKSRRGEGKEHTITVEATDQASNVGKPATVKFTVIRKVRGGPSHARSGRRVEAASHVEAAISAISSSWPAVSSR